MWCILNLIFDVKLHNCAHCLITLDDLIYSHDYIYEHLVYTKLCKQILKISSWNQCNISFWTEKIASELQRFLDHAQLEVESTPTGEESVFNTITSQMGFDFTSTLTDTLQTRVETPDILQRGIGESVGNTTENHNVLLMYNEMASEE